MTHESEVPNKCGRSPYSPGTTDDNYSFGVLWSYEIYSSRVTWRRSSHTQLCAQRGSWGRPAPEQGLHQGHREMPPLNKALLRLSEREQYTLLWLLLPVLLSQVFLLPELLASLFSGSTFFLLGFFAFWFILTQFLSHEVDFYIHFLFLCTPSNFDLASLWFWPAFPESIQSTGRQSSKVTPTPI